MHLTSNVDEYQTKESQCRIRWKYYASISPEKQSSSREEGMSSLPEGEWAAAESQKGMTEKKAKLACQVASPWKTGHLPERIDWVLYWRVIELVLSPKDVWCRRKYEWCLGRINAREESRKGKRKGKRNGKRKGKYNFLYGFDFTWVVNKKDFHQNRDLKINKLHIRVKVHVAMTFLLNLWYLRK